MAIQLLIILCEIRIDPNIFSTSPETSFPSTACPDSSRCTPSTGLGSTIPAASSALKGVGDK